MTLGLLTIAMACIVLWSSGLVRRPAPRSPAARAVIIAGVAAVLAVVQWWVVTRNAPETPKGAVLLFWPGAPFEWLSCAAFVVLLGAVLYPAAWACTVLVAAARGKHHLADWRLIAAAPLVVGLLVSVRYVVRLETDLAQARRRGDERAFHRLYTECQTDQVLCDLVPGFLGTPNREGVLAWIAANPMAPPDIIDAMAHAMAQADDLSLTDALSNPQLPVATFSDSTIIRRPELRYHLLQNPRVPEAVVDSLLVRYPELRAQVAWNNFYLRHRAAPFTLRMLGADTSVDVRSRIAQSFRTPDDLTLTLAGDSSRLVRDGAQLVLALRAYFRTANPSPIEPGGEPEMIRLGPHTDSAVVLVVRSLDGDSWRQPRVQYLWRAVIFRSRGQWQIVRATFLVPAGPTAP